MLRMENMSWICDFWGVSDFGLLKNILLTGMLTDCHDLLGCLLKSGDLGV